MTFSPPCYQPQSATLLMFSALAALRGRVLFKNRNVGIISDADTMLKAIIREQNKKIACERFVITEHSIRVCV